MSVVSMMWSWHVIISTKDYGGFMVGSTKALATTCHRFRKRASCTRMYMSWSFSLCQQNKTGY